MRTSRGAFTLLEVLVVCGIIAVLISITIPVVVRVRGQGKLTLCQSNLRELGHLFNQYASKNRGFIPRSRGGDPHQPVWVHRIMSEVHGRGNWDWIDMPRTQVLQCPVHPDPQVPTGFTINAFAFESRPEWRASRAMPIGLIRNPANVPWLLEVPDELKRADGGYDDIYDEAIRVAFSPEHLPGGQRPRISYTRHGRRANVLFFDGHVEVVRPGQLRLESFDDGIRSRTWD